MEVSERKPYFIEEEDELASSLSEMEAGCSGNKVNSQNGIVPSPFSYVGMNSFSKNTNSYYNNYNHPSYYHHQYSVSSPRSAVSGRFHDFRFDNRQPHFLDSCFLCQKPLGDNRDIYMYRYTFRSMHQIRLLIEKNLFFLISHANNSWVWFKVLIVCVNCRGDVPFCSEECRQEQIERDEAKEKKQSLSYSVKSAMRRKEQRSSSSSPTRSRGYACHNGTIAAAWDSESDYEFGNYNYNNNKKGKQKDKNKRRSEIVS